MASTEIDKLSFDKKFMQFIEEVHKIALTCHRSFLNVPNITITSLEGFSGRDDKWGPIRWPFAISNPIDELRSLLTNICSLGMIHLLREWSHNLIIINKIIAPYLSASNPIRMNKMTNSLENFLESWIRLFKLV